MTRFWITLEESVELVSHALKESAGGETFVPIIPSMRVVDLAKAIEPQCRFKIIGIRPGEKIHETLVSEDEARKTKLSNGYYVILPQFIMIQKALEIYDSAHNVPKGFVYRSDTNDRWLTVEELHKRIA